MTPACRDRPRVFRTYFQPVSMGSSRTEAPRHQVARAEEGDLQGLPADRYSPAPARPRAKVAPPEAAGTRLRPTAPRAHPPPLRRALDGLQGLASVDLSTKGAVTLPFAVGLVTGAVDSLLRPGLGVLSSLVAISLSIFIAARVVPEGLFWAAVLPPMTVFSASVSATILGLGQVSVLGSLSDAAATTFVATGLAATLAAMRHRLAGPRRPAIGAGAGSPQRVPAPVPTQRTGRASALRCGDGLRRSTHVAPQLRRERKE